MTDRRRKRDAAKRLEVLHVGGARHRLDGHWGRSKTIFDSELYRELVAMIDAAIAHAGYVPRSPVVLNFDAIAVTWNLTEKQARALELKSDGKSLREIASVMGISKSGAQNHVHDAIAKLQSGLGIRSSVL